jgi:hypothetical protein
MAQGTCLCGTVQYEVDGPFSMMVHCHCSMCRSHHGTAFATFVAAPLASLRWKSGESNITEYSSSEKGKRPFCNTCGSVTPTRAPEMGLVIIPAGNLTGDLGIKPSMHMFVDYKAPWYSISDDLPQHAQWPPKFAGPSIERPRFETKPGTFGGNCLCDGVAYEFEGPPIRIQSCHCSRCQRGRSAAHATNMLVKMENFRWLRGEALLATYKVPEARFFTAGFCRRCGSSTPVVSAVRGLVIVPAGTVNADPNVKMFAHIFVSHKAPWFEITDGVDQYLEAPPPPVTAPPPNAT